MTREESLKLKVGDLVIATKLPFEYCFSIGKLYEIGGKFYEDDYCKSNNNTVSIVEDDLNCPNGWHHDYFTVACPAIKIIFGAKNTGEKRHD